MKKLPFTLCLCLFATLCLNAQTTPFDNLNANPLTNKAITWTSSNYGSGFGHRIINSDPGGQTLLNFQGRHSSTTWSDIMTLTSNGNVGIGTTNPTGRLHVMGETYIENGWLRVKGNKGLYFQDNGGGFFMEDNVWIRTYGSKNFYHNTGIMRTDGQLEVGPAGNRFVVTGNGNVGIGTTSPDSKLTVKGNIHTNEVKVDLLGAVAPDYVFYKNYDLKSLKAVENYIASNGHLPNIPSAKDMETEGIKLKEMNLKLLEKIEELTLYAIEQEKKLEAQEARLQKLEAHLNSKNNKL